MPIFLVSKLSIVWFFNSWVEIWKNCSFYFLFFVLPLFSHEGSFFFQTLACCYGPIKVNAENPRFKLFWKCSQRKVCQWLCVECWWVQRCCELQCWGCFLWRGGSCFSNFTGVGWDGRPCLDQSGDSEALWVPKFSLLSLKSWGSIFAICFILDSLT